MAYDETLAGRVRRLVMRETDAGERKMFGGLCFMVADRMCCGVLGRELVVRLAPERARGALAVPHVRPMDFTGRPMRGFIYVGPGATRDARALRKWVSEGVAFARSLPARGATPKRPRSKAPRRSRRRGISAVHTASR
ncbi:MAG TPA: TfoX/Sxy family protein [Vicinamibacteria bacterium]|nr:TfoX/Sxy family protein [Vicinamibacteria bacterium]